MGRASNKKWDRRAEKDHLFEYQSIRREQGVVVAELFLSQMSSAMKENRKLAPQQIIEKGRISRFLNIMTVADYSNLGSIAYGRVGSSEPSELHFSSTAIEQRSRSAFTTPSFVDLAIFNELTTDMGPKVTYAHPQSSVADRIALALQVYQTQHSCYSDVAVVLDTQTFNDLNLETGGGDEASKYWQPLLSGTDGRMVEGAGKFMGIPVVEAPAMGEGDIFVISPNTHTVFCNNGVSKETIGFGVFVHPDAVVIGHDPESHIVTKNFDEDTQDWCVDCWTCGYSHWSWEEAEADYLLSDHCEENIYYDKARSPS